MNREIKKVEILGKIYFVEERHIIGPNDGLNACARCSFYNLFPRCYANIPSKNKTVLYCKNRGTTTLYYKEVKPIQMLLKEII